MATVARSNVEITGEDKTGRAFGSVQERMTKLSGRVKAFGAALVGLAGAAGLGALTKSALDSADSMAKLSLRLGISVEELSKYKHVAEQSGVSFNTLATAFQRQNRRIAEAVQGTGVAKAALDELNLSAQVLAAMSPDQQFEAIADAMQNVTGSGDKLRLAVQIWDTEGAALLQTMKDGSAGIREMKEEAEQLGIVLSDEAAADAEKANDAIDELKKATLGAAQVFLVNAAPAIEAVALWLRDWLPEAARVTAEWFNTYIPQAIEWTGAKLDWLRGKFDVIVSYWHRVRAIFAALGASVSYLVSEDVAESLRGVAVDAKQSADAAAARASASTQQINGAGTVVGGVQFNSPFALGRSVNFSNRPADLTGLRTDVRSLPERITRPIVDALDRSKATGGTVYR